MTIMNIIISTSSEKPIYEQIEDQIKTEILNGNLSPGSSLPSIRTLAKEIKVSVITIQRAYEELQRDGFIETIVGRGTFVAVLNKEFYREEKLRQIEQLIDQAVEIAKINGITRDELDEIVSIYFKEE